MNMTNAETNRLNLELGIGRSYRTYWFPRPWNPVSGIQYVDGTSGAILTQNPVD